MDECKLQWHVMHACMAGWLAGWLLWQIELYQYNVCSGDKSHSAVSSLLAC